jgi:hypothetical protein
MFNRILLITSIFCTRTIFMLYNFKYSFNARIINHLSIYFSLPNTMSSTLLLRPLKVAYFKCTRYFGAEKSEWEKKSEVILFLLRYFTLRTPNKSMDIFQRVSYIGWKMYYNFICRPTDLYLMFGFSFINQCRKK